MPSKCLLPAVLLSLAVHNSVTFCAAGDLPWAGKGRYRVVVEAPPTQIGDRRTDELVASYEIDLRKLFPSADDGVCIDLHSLQVVRQDAGAEPYPQHAQQRSSGDRPFRFYDHELLDDFPTWRRYASLEALAGRPVMQPKETLPFGHRVFNALGAHVQGTLVWPHTQDVAKASTYGIYFDLIPTSQPIASPPAGWIGDGSNRIVAQNLTPGPPGNASANVIDWNSDGLPDLLYGMSSGYIVVAENTGTRTSPAFDRRRILFDSSDKPIDVGYDACPLSVDWNGDGVRDLLVGAEKGCILYFQNEGTDPEPAFTYRDFLRVDGELLLTPNWPIAELPNSKPGEVFPADYLAIPCACDWDGDGDMDLLAGGFVTGRIFFFENIGREADGTPRLKARGPLAVDGEPLDTGWAAAPTAIDLDQDGDLDLVCGAKPVSSQGGDASDPTANLYYFENAGDRSHPELKRRDFPSTGPPPTGTNVMAPICDWNGDGLSDLLLVGRSSMQAFAVANVGTAEKPRFDMQSRPIPAAWTNEPIPPGTFVDWNRDGWPDLINRFQVILNDGGGLPHSFSRRINLLAGQEPIRHPAPHGDENSYVTLYDLDGDGDHDCLYGAHSGHIWFHENRGSDETPQMDIAGYQLPLAGGGVIQVGERPADAKAGFNFTVLQGARPKPAPADFDGDGRVDLVIGDTYGRVRFYRNEGTNEQGQPQFAAPELIHEARSRLSVQSADWNGDGAADLFVVTGQRVVVLYNKAERGRTEFQDPQPLKLPAGIGGFFAVAPVDLNGDGDIDLVCRSSARMSCFVERSFLEHGYRPAELRRAETRQP